MKIAKATKEETIHIATGCTILTVVMLAVFFVVKYFTPDLNVFSFVVGGLVSWFLGILNFFLMCLSKQKELDMNPIKGKNFSVLSYNLRTLGMLGIIILCYVVFKLNLVAMLIPLIFPRLTILFMGFTMLKKKKGDDE
ncbi:MAG: ATP synthase subunit I [Oscillospiraceae bacterium]